MNLKKCLLTNNKCYKAGKSLKPEGVMWHSTGANNPKLSRYVQPDDGLLGPNKNGNHWNKPTPDGRNVCVHAFIGLLASGAVATYQTLPWDMRGWHAGGDANDSYIGFEICEDNLKDEKYFKAVYKEACELTAYLCKKYKLDPMKEGVVICHSEGYAMGIASNHSDVMHWFKKFGKTMDDVRRDVKALMGSSDAAAKDKDVDKDKDKDALYKVQCGAFKSKTNAEQLVKELKGDGYDAYIVVTGSTYKVQCGAFSKKSNATKLANTLTKAGYKTIVVTDSSAAAIGKAEDKDKDKNKSKTIKVGSKVKVKKGAKSYDGKDVADFIYNNTYTVDQLKGDRAVLGMKSICTAFKVKDLKKV